jgi:general stress protein 26
MDPSPPTRPPVVDNPEEEAIMVDLDRTANDPEAQFWDELKAVHAGMLGVSGSGQHMQPLAPQVEEETATIWLFTRRSSDLCKVVGAGSQAHFCVISEDHDYHACMSGLLSEDRSPSRIDQFWSPIVASWFERGKDDPDMTLLKLKLADAAIWASTDSSVKFGWEIAKANLTGDEPDIGRRAHLTF